MQNKVHIGIDPGKEGAIVEILDDSIKKTLFPFIGDEYDVAAMAKIFAEFQELTPHVHVVIEDVKALQKPFDRGNWSLSGCKHILTTLCTVYQIPFTLVSSKTWQKEMWQGIPEHRKPSKPDKNEVMRKGSVETKVMSLLAAKRLFPNLDLRRTERSTKDHEGIVDALLMAEYSRRRFD